VAEGGHRFPEQGPGRLRIARDQEADARHLRRRLRLRGACQDDWRGRYAGQQEMPPSQADTATLSIINPAAPNRMAKGYKGQGLV
jgi:hypothetical protein